MMERGLVVAVAGESGKDLCAVLSRLGFRARLAGTLNEAEALLMAEPSPTKVLFSGLVFPDGNWRDLVERSKLHRAGLPIVLCTAEPTAELWWDALECGISDIVTPPFSPASLSRLLSSGLIDQ